MNAIKLFEAKQVNYIFRHLNYEKTIPTYCSSNYFILL
jgi:hypothetical protein